VLALAVLLVPVCSWCTPVASDPPSARDTQGAGRVLPASGMAAPRA